VLDSLFSLKFTAKQLSKQSSKASKDEQKEIEKLKKALQKGNSEGAKIYAANAIRKKNVSLNLLRLSSRIDAVTSRVQTAVTMRAVTGSMGKVVQGMDVAMRNMDLERISAVMDKFETQFADLDVQTGYMEDTMQDSTAVSTPQDQVDLLMQRVCLGRTPMCHVRKLMYLMTCRSQTKLVSRYNTTCKRQLWIAARSQTWRNLQRTRQTSRRIGWQRGCELCDLKPRRTHTAATVALRTACNTEDVSDLVLVYSL
jgi:charged multivesicular body protein 1